MLAAQERRVRPTTAQQTKAMKMTLAQDHAARRPVCLSSASPCVEVAQLRMTARTSAHRHDLVLPVSGYVREPGVAVVTEASLGSRYPAGTRAALGPCSTLCLSSTVDSIAILCVMAGNTSVDAPVRRAFEALMRPPVQLAAAEAVATARCMERRGFRYPTAAAMVPIRAVTPRRLGGLGRPLQVEEAESEGYGFRITPRPGTDPTDQVQSHYISSLSPSEREDYHRALAPEGGLSVQVELPAGMVVGAAAAGCVAWAREVVYGSVETYLRLAYVANEVPHVADAAIAHGRVRAALRAYATCMAGKGIPVKTPMLAVQLAEQRFGGTRPAAGPVSEEEREMAVADAICQQNTGINEAIDDAVVETAASWINGEASRLLGLAAQQHQALERANKLLDLTR